MWKSSTDENSFGLGSLYRVSLLAKHAERTSVSSYRTILKMWVQNVSSSLKEVRFLLPNPRVTPEARWTPNPTSNLGVENKSFSSSSLRSLCLLLRSQVSVRSELCLFYRVSIKSFPDYKYLLQENYVEYKHISFSNCNSTQKVFLCNTLVHLNMCSFCIPHSFLVINVCNQGKSLCSPCILEYSYGARTHER
jgi:hypothetical protein